MPDKIPTFQSELLEEMGLRNGDCVCVYANFEDNKIIIKKGNKKK
jgi:bifunctional DNA-binding transcriptional regulator/antitoxin component of YhaV-PrlF toxin-antitoxin module